MPSYQVEILLKSCGLHINGNFAPSPLFNREVGQVSLISNFFKESKVYKTLFEKISFIEGELSRRFVDVKSLKGIF